MTARWCCHTRNPLTHRDPGRTTTRNSWRASEPTSTPPGGCLHVRVGCRPTPLVRRRCVGRTQRWWVRWRAPLPRSTRRTATGCLPSRFRACCSSRCSTNRTSTAARAGRGGQGFGKRARTPSPGRRARIGGGLSRTDIQATTSFRESRGRSRGRGRRRLLCWAPTPRPGRRCLLGASKICGLSNSTSTFMGKYGSPSDEHGSGWVTSIITGANRSASSCNIAASSAAGGAGASCAATGDAEVTASAEIRVASSAPVARRKSA